MTRTVKCRAYSDMRFCRFRHCLNMEKYKASVTLQDGEAIDYKWPNRIEPKKSRHTESVMVIYAHKEVS